LFRRTPGENVYGCVGGLYAASVYLVNGDAAVGVGHVGDDGVQVQTGVLFFQEGGGFSLDDPVVATLIPGIVVLVAELVEN
jgi:hypothetical protein